MKKTYDDDDGRTISDMSNVDMESVFSGMFLGMRYTQHRKKARQEREMQRSSAPVSIDRSERRSAIFGSLSAVLLIGLILMAGIALIILLILWIGHAI